MSNQANPPTYTAEAKDTKGNNIAVSVAPLNGITNRYTATVQVGSQFAHLTSEQLRNFIYHLAKVYQARQPSTPKLKTFPHEPSPLLQADAPEVTEVPYEKEPDFGTVVNTAFVEVTNLSTATVTPENIQINTAANTTAAAMALVDLNEVLAGVDMAEAEEQDDEPVF